MQYYAVIQKTEAILSPGVAKLAEEIKKKQESQSSKKLYWGCVEDTRAEENISTIGDVVEKI